MIHPFSFVTQYLSLVFFFLLFGIGSIMYRQAPVKARDMDFVTDLAEIEADSYEEAPPKNFGEKAWQWLVSILRFYTKKHPHVFHRCKLYLTQLQQQSTRRLLMRCMLSGWRC